MQWSCVIEEEFVYQHASSETFISFIYLYCYQMLLLKLCDQLLLHMPSNKGHLEKGSVKYSAVQANRWLGKSSTMCKSPGKGNSQKQKVQKIDWSCYIYNVCKKGTEESSNMSWLLLLLSISSCSSNLVNALFTAFLFNSCKMPTLYTFYSFTQNYAI